MLVLDYLIVNEDRHLNNFGAVRNVNTLEWTGCAPIYDSGTSLWFDKPWTMISAGAKAASKPFKTTHDEQIKLVSSFDWLDIDALAGIDEELRELVKRLPLYRYDPCRRSLRRFAGARGTAGSGSG